MKPHLQMVAILNIAAGAIYILIAIALFLMMGMITGLVISQGEHEAAGLIGIIATGLCCFLAVLGLPSVLAAGRSTPGKAGEDRW